jgi:outer membrane protein OmpA-like peptidoglycan-associated protein
MAATAVAIAAASSVLAAPALSDRPGGKDHPLISRYQGSLLYHYGGESLGPAQLVDRDKGKPQLRTVEGRLSNRMYWGPKDRSAVEIFRNYQAALQAAGFQAMYSCETAECERQGIQEMVQELPRKAAWGEFDSMVASTFNSGNQPAFHYLSARKGSGAGTTYVQVALAGTRNDGDSAGRVRQFVQVIEPAQAEMGKVTVDAKAIGAGLQRDGKIALYGVHFDTNKAVLREDSAAQLQSMAEALKAQPAMKVLIVGHTDNQGEIEANLALSQKRAQAVVDALSARYGIPASRLSARGVASFAPVSTNATEAGRGQNRRVELVVR